eukprot:SAG31_NODE_1218_length_9303_cov_4.349087_2_plen_67_part_00
MQENTERGGGGAATKESKENHKTGENGEKRAAKRDASMITSGRYEGGGSAQSSQRVGAVALTATDD